MSAFDWRSTKLLIIDSDAKFCDWAKALFDGVRATSSVYRDGESALDSVRGGFTPDLVVLELELPRLPAPTLIRRFRNPDTMPVPNAPIVVTSKDPNKIPGLMRSACLAGIESFLKKPTPDEQFIKRIQSTIVRPKRFVATRTYYGPDRRQEPPLEPEYKGPERRREQINCTPRPTAKSNGGSLVDAAPAGKKPSGGKIDDLPAAQKPVKTNGAVETAPDASPPKQKAPLKDADALALARSTKAKAAGDAPVARPAKATPPQSTADKQAAQKKPASKPVASPAAERTGKKPTGGKLEAASNGARPRPSSGKLEAAADKPSKKKRSSDEDWKSALGKAEKDKKKKNGKTPDVDVEAVLAGHATWLKSRGTRGQKAALEGKDLYGVDLNGANLTSANIRNAVLADANLSGAVLESADLRYVDLTGSVVSDGNLAVANMRHANMKAANLERAILRGVDLAGACLTNAILVETDFTGANLLSTDVRDADLSGSVGLTQRQIGKIIANSKTKLPAGLRRPKTD